MSARNLAFFIIALALFSCGSGSNPQNNQKDDTFIRVAPIDSTRKGIAYPKQMNMVRKSAYDNFNLRLGNDLYNCSYKGVFEITDTNGQNGRHLFDLEAEYLIDVIYFQPLGNDVYFVTWQETDHTGVKSHFATYKAGAKDPIWQRMESAPAPGQPAIDSQYVYITTLGIIAKLNVYNGEVVWRHDSLFDPYKSTYKKFDKPLLYTSTVCFYDFPIRQKKARRDSIWVNDATGRIGK